MTRRNFATSACSLLWLILGLPLYAAEPPPVLLRVSLIQTSQPPDTLRQGRSWNTQPRTPAARQIQVLDGHWARLQSATVVALFPRRVPIPRGHPAADHQSAEQVLLLRPRLYPQQQVVVEITLQDDRFLPRGDSSLQQRGLSTTVAGPLGQWLPLTGAMMDNAPPARRITSDPRNQTWWIRVQRASTSATP